MELQDHAATTATVIVALIGRDVLKSIARPPSGSTVYAAECDSDRGSAEFLEQVEKNCAALGCLIWTRAAYLS
jgi:hypothetical protein